MYWANKYLKGMSILNDTFYISEKGTIFTSAYIIRINIFTIAQAVFLTGAFDFKAVLLIDLNGRLIINKYR